MLKSSAYPPLPPILSQGSWTAGALLERALALRAKDAPSFAKRAASPSD